MCPSRRLLFDRSKRFELNIVVAILAMMMVTLRCCNVELVVL